MLTISSIWLHVIFILKDGKYIGICKNSSTSNRWVTQSKIKAIRRIISIRTIYKNKINIR